MTASIRDLTIRDLTIRDLTAADLDEVVRLNNSATPAVPHASAAELADLIDSADHTLAVPDAEGVGLIGFLIGFDPGSDYRSENYRWFASRGVDGLYVDRLVVDERCRGRRIGQALYDRVFQLARAAGRAEVTCEVNVRPPNPGSMAFHSRLGFVEVGRQATKGGSVEVALLAASARSRLVSWVDPTSALHRMKESTGLEFLTAMLDGHVPAPPIAALMRMTPTAVAYGSATFECHPDESHYNPIGTVHGGLVPHAARLRDRLRRAVHPAGGDRVHLDRDQGQLPQDGSRRHRHAHRHRDRDEARKQGGVRRGIGRRRRRSARGDGEQQLPRLPDPLTRASSDRRRRIAVRVTRCNGERSVTEAD